MTSMCPKYRQWQIVARRHLGAHLNQIDWLEAKGLACDVATDHDLHQDGGRMMYLGGSGCYRVTAVDKTRPK